MKNLQKALLGVGIPAILWLVIFFSIRKKNKPLSLQAYVEKKISWCLKLRFLIKNVKFSNKKITDVVYLENFEAQGASGPRWLNIQMINLICSCFPDFNYVFKFNDLSDDDYNELKPIIEYDFKMVDLIKSDDIQFNQWEDKKRKNLFNKKKSKTEELELDNNQKTTENEQPQID